MPLPPVPGQRISAINLDILREHTLDYYDGPRMVLLEEHTGTRHLAVWNDGSDHWERWVLLETGDSRLGRILRGRHIPPGGPPEPGDRVHHRLRPGQHDEEIPHHHRRRQPPGGVPAGARGKNEHNPPARMGEVGEQETTPTTNKESRWKSEYPRSA